MASHRSGYLSSFMPKLKLARVHDLCTSRCRIPLSTLLSLSHARMHTLRRSHHRITRSSRRTSSSSTRTWCGSLRTLARFLACAGQQVRAS
eukprot:3631995-Pleurochrysis_carterae.AAC.1